MYLDIIFIVLTSIYIFHIIRFYRGLFRLSGGKSEKLPDVSIIIPARNEEENIAACLDSLVKQNYPPEKIEIYIMNDRSTDNTACIADQYSQHYSRIKHIQLTENTTYFSHKKFAINEGIGHSSNELIFTTDADCVASPEWIRNTIKYFNPTTGMVCGFVVFDQNKERTLFHKIQSLEFLSLVIAGAGSIGSDMPIIGNGANLAYRRSVFEQVNGFRDLPDLQSGDDDLLIQKVARLTSWKIRFSIEPDTTIATEPVATLNEFINQRSRWASKGIHYHNPLFVAYLVAIYLYYALLFFTLPVALLQPLSFPVPIISLMLKMTADFLLIKKGTRMAGRSDLLRYFLPAELFQIPYILFVGLSGIFQNFNWKNR